MRIKRIQSDIREMRDLEGIFYHPNEDNINLGSVMMIGPEGTPYEGGFYHMDMELPESYPICPPKMEFKTYDPSREVRFHPNLYTCGTICLSIINTYDGDSWTPCQSIKSVLLSIISLLDEQPLRHEPYISIDDQMISDYNMCISHENIRIATLYMLSHNPHPEFQETMERYFCDHIERYLAFCQRHMHRDGVILCAPVYHVPGKSSFKVTLNFRRLYHQLLQTYCMLSPKYHSESDIELVRKTYYKVRQRIVIRPKGNKSPD